MLGAWHLLWSYMACVHACWKTTPAIRCVNMKLTQLNEAKEKLAEAESELEKVEKERHRIEIVEQAGKKIKMCILSPDEKAFLEFPDMLKKAKRHVTFWQHRLEALQHTKRGQDELNKMRG